MRVSHTRVTFLGNVTLMSCCSPGEAAELIVQTSVFLKYLEKHDLIQIQETITEYAVYSSYHENVQLKLTRTFFKRISLE